MSVCTPKSFDLTGKVALITGASYGIGKAGDDVVGLVGKDLRQITDFLVATFAPGVGNDEGHLGVDLGEEILKIFRFEEFSPVTGTTRVNIEDDGAILINC